MRIKRRDILKAIRTENLKAGTWIHGKDIDVTEGLYTYSKTVYDKTCKVCAVGAVLRQKGVLDEDIDLTGNSLINMQGIANHEGDEVEALEDKQYLRALSIKFEKLVLKLGNGKRTKVELIKFVKAKFPKTINESL